MTNRQRQWLRQDRAKSVYRRSMTPVFVSALNKQIVPVIERLGEVSDIRDFEVVQIDNTPLEAAYRKLYLATTVDYARKMRAKLKKSMIKQDVFDDLIQENVLAYLRIHGASTITAAGDTSLKLIKELVRAITEEIVSQGLSASEGVTMLRDRITSEWHRAARFRTERIVRTEVNRASNYGSLEGMKSIGVPMRKVWLSAFVETSRPAHIDADGQKVTLEDAFTIDNESLQYPGDPAGSSGNTINCLCSVYEELI